MRSLAALAVIFAITIAPMPLLNGCSSTPEQADETANWSAQKLYEEARGAMNDGAWDKAVKLFEKLESRFPYGRYAQQAQLEIAYASYKQSEPASALAACDRFIRLHPNHPNVDYAYFLKGIINFNEDLGLFGYLSQQDVTERDPKAARESFDAFKELVTKFPNSKYASDATARMKYLVNALAAHGFDRVDIEPGVEVPRAAGLFKIDRDHAAVAHEQHQPVAAARLHARNIAKSDAFFLAAFLEPRRGWAIGKIGHHVEPRSPRLRHDPHHNPLFDANLPGDRAFAHGRQRIDRRGHHRRR